MFGRDCVPHDSYRQERGAWYARPISSMPVLFFATIIS